VRGYGYQSLGVREAGATLGGRYLAVLSAEATHWLDDAWGVAAFVDAGNAYDAPAQARLALGYGLGGWQRSGRAARLDVATAAPPAKSSAFLVPSPFRHSAAPPDPCFAFAALGATALAGRSDSGLRAVAALAERPPGGRLRIEAPRGRLAGPLLFGALRWQTRTSRSPPTTSHSTGPPVGAVGRPEQVRRAARRADPRTPRRRAPASPPPSDWRCRSRWTRRRSRFPP
jgi:translocation and assembly module TamA